MNPIQLNISAPVKEAALRLPKSKGSIKSRIHLYDYQGPVGQDKYAVAAKILNKSKPSLNFFEKRYFVLIEKTEADGSSTWYKVNKNSLKKRLGITSTELKSHSENLIELIHKKLEIANQPSKSSERLSESSYPEERFERLSESSYPEDLRLKVESLLQDKERLDKVPRATQGNAAHNIYILEEDDLPIVIRAGVDDKRFDCAIQAHQFAKSKGFDLLTIPKPWKQGHFTIEKQIPVEKGGSLSSLAFYVQHHQDFDPAIQQFISFLSQVELGDLIGNSKHLLNVLHPNMPRYDNLLVFQEQNKDKIDYKIALIDTETFKMLKKKPGRDHFLKALSTAINFFPYNYDTIIEAGNKLKLKKHELETLKNEQKEALNYFENVHQSHLRHLENHHIGFDNASYIAPISADLQEELKDKLKQNLLELHHNGTEDDEFYFSSSKAKGCLGQNTQESLKYFEDQLFPTYINFILKRMNLALNSFEQGPPSSQCELLAKRSKVIDTNHCWSTYQINAMTENEEANENLSDDLIKLDGNTHIKRLLMQQLCEELVKEGILSYSGVYKDDDRIAIFF